MRTCISLLENYEYTTMKNILCFLTCLSIALCASFSGYNLPKCPIRDNECQRSSYQNLIKNVGKSGIPEKNISPLDPVVLKNFDVGIANVVNLTLVDGVVKGVSNCVINRFEVDIEKWIGKQKITCDVTIKGHYILSGDSDLLKRFLGSGGIRGDGTGKVKLEKLTLNLKYPLYPEKRDDGEIYFVCSYKDLEYDYDIKGRASFALDNVLLGKDNISEFVVNYLNENWKYVLKTFGKVFVDKAMEYYFDFMQKFYNGVPAKEFTVEDLTPYLKD